MNLFLVLSPPLFLAFLGSLSERREFYRRVGTFLGGALWTYALAILYWLFRIREQIEYDPLSLTLHFFTTEFLIFWGPNLALFLLFGRKTPGKASVDSFLFWFGGVSFFMGLRDAIVLTPSAQPTELFVVPLYRLLTLGVCHWLFERWEDTFDLYAKILWAAALPVVWLVVSAIVALAFAGLDWLALLLWAAGATSLYLFRYHPRLSLSENA